LLPGRVRLPTLLDSSVGEGLISVGLLLRHVEVPQDGAEVRDARADQQPGALQSALGTLDRALVEAGAPDEVSRPGVRVTAGLVGTLSAGEQHEARGRIRLARRRHEHRRVVKRPADGFIAHASHTSSVTHCTFRAGRRGVSHANIRRGLLPVRFRESGRALVPGLGVASAISRAPHSPTGTAGSGACKCATRRHPSVTLITFRLADLSALAGIAVRLPGKLISSPGE
jgi:hypothetical protein